MSITRGLQYNLNQNIMFVRFVKYPGESQWAQYVEAAHQGGAEERLRPLHVPGGCFHMKHNIA